jgi:hypothetical protein
MPAFRFLGSLLLLLGVVILVADLTSARGFTWGGLAISTAKHWAGIAPTTLAAAQKSVQSISPLLWDPLAKAVLSIPAWGLFAGLGGLLIWLGRRRRRVNIFVN